MSAQILRPNFGSRPRPISNAVRSNQLTESHQLAVETLRMTGLAAMHGNKQAVETLGMYSSLTGEPLIARAATKFLNAIDRIVVMAPCDCEPDPAA